MAIYLQLPEEGKPSPRNLRESIPNILDLLKPRNSVDVLDPYGTLIVRVVTNFMANNFAFAGPEYRQLWMVGNGGVSMVEWALQGIALA